MSACPFTEEQVLWGGLANSSVFRHIYLNIQVSIGSSAEIRFCWKCAGGRKRALDVWIKWGIRRGSWVRYDRARLPSCIFLGLAPWRVQWWDIRTSWMTATVRKNVWLELCSPRERQEKAMVTHSSTLAWKIPWMGESGRLQSMGLLRVGHDWATSLSLFTLMRWRRKWQPTPVFLPAEFQGRRSLVGCRLWGHTESDTTEAT